MYSQPGIVKSTKPSTTGGCDTLVTYYLELRPQPTRAVTISFCPGESVMIGGNTYSQSGTVVSPIPATNGTCDTLVTYTLELKSQPTRAEKRTFCPGQSVLIAGQSYNQSGQVVANLPSNTGGCDTVVTYTLELLTQTTLAYTRSICPGQSLVIGGQTYNQAGTVIQHLASTSGGCDTIVTYTIEMQAPPARVETREFCQGQSVTIGGQIYNQPGTVFANLASTTGGCDTVVKYTLEMLPQPVKAETLGLCPGESIAIAGQQYNQPGVFMANLPSNTGGCDTLVTYTITQRPQPSRSEILSFCPGESVVIAGQTYTQAGTIVENIPSNTGGCDTVVTYKLQYLTPAPSNIALKCPTNMTSLVASGSGPVAVSYADPIAASDCICPGLELNRTSGPASESLFPIGNTQVCYRVKDNCGQEKSCCFSVNIKEEEACEVKTNGCIRYELLSITADPTRNRTYRIRVTNNCASKLIHTAIQIPDGLTAMDPGNNLIYSSSENRNYLVRSPNFSPMYSIRFKSTTDSISNGQSDVFEYTLPAQAEVEYISVVTRLAQQSPNEAYLTTFNCPVGITPSNRVIKTKSRDAEVALDQQNSLLLFPNPTQGVLFADLSDWQGKNVQIQVTNALGQLIHTMKLVASDDLLRIEMPQGATNGIYFMEVAPESGKKEIMRFMIQR
jgi:Ni,Fe-hydrogenase III small subunit